MAPMVAASDYPFRELVRNHCGVDLCFTQMIHSKNFCRDPKFRKSHLDLYEAGGTYDSLLPSQVACLGNLPLPSISNKDIKDRSAPLIVQLAGHDVDIVVQAALLIMEHTNGQVSGFDLNCGCPQAIARKGRYGAFLMEENDALVCQILSALRKALPESTMVSAKIRLPLDDETLADRIPRLVETGIHFLTIHGRTLEENKTKVGAIHTDRMRLAIEAAHRVDPSFPVVANGGMETYTDVQHILQATGAFAAMSSEALLETPDIFCPESLHLDSLQRMERQFFFARQYLHYCATVAPPVPGVLGASKYHGGSFTVIRGHLFKFLYRYLNEHVDLRDKLAGERTAETIPDAMALIDQLYERYVHLSDDQFQILASSSPEATWYRRHRKPGRTVHQKQVRISSTVQQPAALQKLETLEERKHDIQQRIQRLQQQKQQRMESSSKRFSFLDKA